MFTSDEPGYLANRPPNIEFLFTTDIPTVADAQITPTSPEHVRTIVIRFKKRVSDAPWDAAGPLAILLSYDWAFLEAMTSPAHMPSLRRIVLGFASTQEMRVFAEHIMPTVPELRERGLWRFAVREGPWWAVYRVTSDMKGVWLASNREGST